VSCRLSLPNQGRHPLVESKLSRFRYGGTRFFGLGRMGGVFSSEVGRINLYELSRGLEHPCAEDYNYQLCP